ncbi:MAG TPA: SCO family protein [Stellaceae bacterium]|nr:SCO family protein [Stellaceae bacterium]
MADTTSKTARVPRFAVIAMLLAAILIIAAGALVGLAMRHSPNGNFLASAVGGPFHLVDQNGKPFTDADLKGKWNLVFFGYTHCPDECPLALNNMALALDALGSKRSQVRIVFVTVDPSHDTPEVLKTYIKSFDAPMVGLTGSDAQIAQAAKDYHVYYAAHQDSHGKDTLDHSTIIYIMNPKGQFVAPVTSEDSSDKIAARLKKLLS